VSTLLDISDLVVRYGGVNAVDRVSLTVEPGTVVGLIGPNGAGKTTLVDALTGFVPTAQGTITFDGARIDDLPAHERARRGVVRTFQSIELFEDLTVRENVLAAAERTRWWSLFADVVTPARGVAPADVDWALSLFDLDETADRLPSVLSLGQRKLVGVARALASRPKLLLLDEPAAGLDTGESQILGMHLRGVLDHGITVLLVDHDMALVLGVCDTLWVLDYGRLIAHGTPEEIQHNADVVTAYLGTTD
jgi:ABC-type branched-subunit amino acid transport system ATPase component